MLSRDQIRSLPVKFRSPCQGEVKSGHFPLSSGLSMSRRGHIRILPVKFQSLCVEKRSDSIRSYLVPVGKRGRKKGSLVH